MKLKLLWKCLPEEAFVGFTWSKFSKFTANMIWIFRDLSFSGHGIKI